jgi:hypothetical protein
MFIESDGISKLLNAKWLLGGTLAVYSFYFVMLSRNSQQKKYHVSATRIISRITGRMTNMPLPPYLR